MASIGADVLAHLLILQIFSCKGTWSSILDLMIIPQRNTILIINNSFCVWSAFTRSWFAAFTESSCLSHYHRLILDWDYYQAEEIHIGFKGLLIGGRDGSTDLPTWTRCLWRGGRSCAQNPGEYIFRWFDIHGIVLMVYGHMYKNLGYSNRNDVQGIFGHKHEW